MGTIASLDVNLGMNVGSFISGAAKGRGAMTDLGQVAERVYQDTRTAAERYAVKLGQISGLYRRGQLDVETYRRAVAKLKDELRAAEAAEARAAGGLAALKGHALSLAGSFGVAVSAAAAIRELVSFLGSSYQAYREANLQQQKLAAVLESTGHAAGFSKAQLNALASQLQALTNYDDDAVAGAQAVLATFKEIKGAEFTRATESILDLSAVMDQDLKSSAVQLGKALNDPVRGLTALRRVGVSFSAEQEEMIKTLAESGRMAEAQGEILKELESEFGGAARAMRNEVTGLANDWGDLKEAIGSFGDSDAAKAGLKGLSGGIRQITTDINDMSAAMNNSATSAERLKGFLSFLELTAPGTGPAGLVSGMMATLAKRQLGETTPAAAPEQAADHAAASTEAAKAQAKLGESIDKVTQDLQRQVVTFGMAADSIKIWELQTQGATAEQLAEANAAWESIRRLREQKEATDNAAKAAADLKKKEDDLIASLQMQVTTFGNSAEEIKLFELEMSTGKASEQARFLLNQLEALRAAKEAAEEAAKAQEDLANAGKRVFDETRTPLEKYEARLEELKHLLDGAAIDQETFDRAASKAHDELLAAQKPGHAAENARPGALLKGSAAAFSAANRGVGRDSEQEKTRKILGKEARETNVHLRAMAKAQKRKDQLKVINNFN